MTKVQRTLVLAALLGLVTLSVMVGTHTVTGNAARVLDGLRGALLILAALVTGWRWNADKRGNSFSTKPAESAGSETEMSGFARTILGGESNAGGGAV